MSLQWYPGHMTKARRELAALMPSQDVVLEVLDARAPASSANPVLAELRGGKPCIRILARSDLADPEVTKAWLAEARGAEVRSFAATIERPQETRKRITELCAILEVRRKDRPIRALITGIPNVGKSTLINTLLDRKVAAVGDKPAITKGQQTVALGNSMLITDTPGLMWPGMNDDDRTYRLALAGSIPDTAIDYVTLGRFGAALLLERYPALVVARYKLAAPPATGEALLEEIARRRGGLRKGGAIDLHKGAEILIHELRAGTLGRVSLESPVSPPAPAC